MNFQQYSSFRNDVLATRADVLDAGETRIVASLGNLRTPMEQLQLPARAHRCHLAEFWLDYFQLDRQLKPRTLISRGVRHSLSILFAHWAAGGKTVLIPKDVYPVYAQLAQTAGVTARDYALWPEDGWGSLADVDVILVTNPAKPRAGVLSGAEVAQLEAWLAEDRARRVVIDAVYTFAAPLDAVTMRLLASGQAILLHSLSKSWVQPLVLGVALVPDADVETLTPLFRAEPPEQPNLQLAQALLTQDTAFPATLASLLREKQRLLQSALALRGCPVRLTAAVPSYLFVVDLPHEQLLEQFGVLGIPFSAFGNEVSTHCILSSLAVAPSR